MRETSARAIAHINSVRTTFDAFAQLVAFLDGLTSAQKAEFVEMATASERENYESTERYAEGSPSPIAQDTLKRAREAFKNAYTRAEDRSLLHLVITTRDNIIVRQDLESPDLSEYMDLITSAKKVEITSPHGFTDAWSLHLESDSGLDIHFRSPTFERTKDTIERIKSRLSKMRPWWWWAKAWAFLIIAAAATGGSVAQMVTYSAGYRPVGSIWVLLPLLVVSISLLAAALIPRVRFVETPWSFRAVSKKALTFVASAVLAGVISTLIANWFGLF